MNAHLLTLAGLLLAATLQSQTFPPNPVGPDRTQAGPWDNDVVVYRVRPGGTPERLATFERAGVPTVARLKDGRLIAAFQRFPQNDDRHFDRVAVSFSSDEGRTWDAPAPITVEDLTAGLARPFDPTLVPLPDGRVRLYFTSSLSPDFRRSTPAIYSAISTNGIHYRFEPGVRFSVEGRIVIDCAVALHQGTFHLIVPDNGTADDFGNRPQPGPPPGTGSGYHALSKDGLEFQRVADVKLPSTRDRWLGNMQSDDTRLAFMGTGPGPWPVTSTDGTNWETDAGALRIPGADPGVLRLRDGSWLVLVTGEPRPGTPTAQLRLNPRGQPPAGNPGAPGNRLPDPMRPGPQPRGGGSSPREHQVLSATSRDGLTWTRDEGVRLTSASVPCAINDRDQRVLLYVVRPPAEPAGIGGLACAVSTNGTDFTVARDFRIDGLSTRTAADPSILKDGAGKFRLYYLASNFRGDPASGENPHRINLATSDDGLHFRETGTAFTYDNLVDPDVFRFKDNWFMYVFARRGTVVATSTDGNHFQYLRDMTPRDWGTTAAVPLPDGRLRLYAFEQRVPFGNAVKSFLSTNGVDWTEEPGERLRAGSEEQVTDPFVIPWQGGWKMYFKTAPMPSSPPPAFAPGSLRRPPESTGPL